jgi:hypothetical protein
MQLAPAGRTNNLIEEIKGVWVLLYSWTSFYVLLNALGS